jgi:hypothetical protein
MRRVFASRASVLILMIAALSIAACPAPGSQGEESYDDLLALFAEWRAFEQPPLLNGAPDYTAATFATRHE